MNKFIRQLAALFLAVGLVLLAGSGFLVVRTRAFLARAERATGTVVELSVSRDTDSTTYHPVIRFTTSAGRERTFRSHAGSNPPSFDVGEVVEVLYDPADPTDARIDATFDLWGGAAIVGLLGTIFTAVGAGIFIVRSVLSRRADALRRTGMRVAARFQSVERNTRLEVNGQHPWRIVAQWQDPTTGALHLLRSENLWFDPTPYVAGELTAWVDRKNPKRHVVDVSFLPKLAA